MHLRVLPGERMVIAVARHVCDITLWIITDVSTDFPVNPRLMESEWWYATDSTTGDIYIYIYIDAGFCLYSLCVTS